MATKKTPVTTAKTEENETAKEEPKVKGKTPASISFVPAVCGLILAGEVINDIIK